MAGSYQRRSAVEPSSWCSSAYYGYTGVLPANPAWGVEVSTDGNTWQPAVGPAAGQTSWSFAWTPAVPGSVTIRSRAFDDSRNLETPGSGVTVSVAANPAAELSRAGTFRGAALIVSVGVNVATLTSQLRLIGIFTEGPIGAPAAAALEAEAENP